MPGTQTLKPTQTGTKTKADLYSPKTRALSNSGVYVCTEDKFLFNGSAICVMAPIAMLSLWKKKAGDLLSLRPHGH